MKRRAAKRAAPALPADADLLRLGYSSKKLPSEVDYIIVGSGLSGLYLAALLAKLGKRVLVLEQHYVAGGCTHTFKDKGFEFDTGVHYVGQGTELTALMNFGAGQHGSFEMVRSGEEDGSLTYNQIQVGDSKYFMRPGISNFVNDFISNFPEDEVAMRKFIREATFACIGMGFVTVKHLLPMSLWSTLLKLPGPIQWLRNRYMKRTLTEVLNDCGFKNPKAKAYLSSEFGDYGTVPDEAPFFLHAIILRHYTQEGSFYPLGGSDAFAEALIPGIVEAGGRVLVRAPVSKIIVQNGRAVGVEVKGKDIIYAKRAVVSSAGVEATYRKLLDEVDVQKLGGVPQSLVETESNGSAHHVYCFIGLDGNSKELGLPTYNVWSFPTACTPGVPDLTAAWKETLGGASQMPEFLTSQESASKVELSAFLSFPSAKDPRYDSRCPGKSTAVVLTESRSEFFDNSGPPGKRVDSYEKIKGFYKEALLNAFLRHFPHLKDKVSYVDIATPWTNEHYLGRRGSYGLDQNVSRFLDPTLTMAPRNISGLYLTGQDFLSCGVFAQPMVAWITLSKVLGLTSLDFWVLSADMFLAVLKSVTKKAILGR